MARAQVDLTWDGHKVAIRRYVGLGTSTTRDDDLQLWFAASVVDCDNFCGWYYLDDNDDLVDNTPDDCNNEPLIVLGVYEWIKAAYRLHGSPASGGVKMAKTDRLQESYAGGDKGITLSKAARATAHDLWQQAVDNLLLLGAGY